MAGLSHSKIRLSTNSGIDIESYIEEVCLKNLCASEYQLPYGRPVALAKGNWPILHQKKVKSWNPSGINLGLGTGFNPSSWPAKGAKKDKVPSKYQGCS